MSAPLARGALRRPRGLRGQSARRRARARPRRLPAARGRRSHRRAGRGRRLV